MSRTTPWWVLAVAASFFVYFALVMYCEIWRAEGPGFHADFASGRMVLTEIVPGSPGDRAGLQPGDVVTAAGGKTIAGTLDWKVVDSNVEFNRPIRLDVERNGRRTEATLTLGHGTGSYLDSWPRILLLLGRSVQFIALALALVVVLRRPDDLVARLGAWVLASIGVFDIVLPTRLAAVWRGLPLPVGLFLWVPHVSADYAVGAVLFTFFASFPRQAIRSPRAWGALWIPMALALLLSARYALYTVYAPARADAFLYQAPVLTVVTAAYALAGLIALFMNYRRLTDVNERRRVKVLVVGAVGGLAPGFLVIAYSWLRSSADLSESIFRSPAASIGTLSLLCFPVSFAYAILRHRLFEIGTLIRQGLQYALARRVLESLVPVLGLALAADVLLHREQTLASVVGTRGWAYLTVGVLIMVARAWRQTWLSRLDRRFFREQYNAQKILRSVAEDVRSVGDFERVAPRVVAQIDRALHPEFAALLVRQSNEEGYRVVVATPAGLAPPPLREDTRLVALLRLLNKPLDVSADRREWLAEHLPQDEIDFLKRGRIELLVPIVTNPDQTESVLALGLKRSEEPYTHEDIDLIAVVAADLALLLERRSLSAPPAPPATATFEECPDCGACYDAGTTSCTRDGQRLAPTQLPRVLAARYHLERRLGQGGLGKVYEALDTALDRKVAVKVIRDDLVANRDIATRFQREGRLAAAFVHPNVVTVHDFGVTNGRAFLVMELLAGTTLREELSGPERLPTADTVQILRHVCAAVDAGHRRRIVHRDLKPENVFLVASESGRIAKVLDFGIAKYLPTGALTAASMQTGAGVLLGTLPYMAPEQLRGEEAQPASDLWALAVIAHEMLTGVHPFAPSGACAVPLGRQQAVAVQAPGITAATRAFFARALSPDPADRLKSAADLLADLERALA